MAWTVDTSWLAKLFLDEPGSVEVRESYREAVDAAEPLLAPMLLPYELGRTVQREYGPEAREEGVEALELALRNVRLVDPDPATVFQVAGPLTSYDAAYVAVADEEGAGLRTVDDDMRARAEELGIEVMAS